MKENVAIKMFYEKRKIRYLDELTNNISVSIGISRQSCCCLAHPLCQWYPLPRILAEETRCELCLRGYNRQRGGIGSRIG